MKITFVFPCVGRDVGKNPGAGKRPKMRYVKSWLMEPLAIAVLSAHTPKNVTQVFYDDRLEPIDYDAPTDLVAINVETYTAKRAYQIAATFKAKNVLVVMGGFHATLMPEETGKFADAVVTGQAESVWKDVLFDAERKKLKALYKGADRFYDHDYDHVYDCEMLPNRKIYADKKKFYTKIDLIETGRGCRYKCEFCSVSSFFQQKYYPRPVSEVVREIKSLGSKNVFFIDDNFAVDKNHVIELCKAITPLNIRWVGQVSLDIAKSDDLLEAMQKSGCICVLIGFESLNTDNLESMGKSANLMSRDYDRAMENLRKYGIGVYATFVFGYDNDTSESFEKTLTFGIKHKFFFTAFNHLMPFPGTPLYERLKNENRLIHDPWWLSDKVRFGDVVIRPKNLSADKLSELCFKYRKKFYSLASIIKRIDFKSNFRNLVVAAAYLGQNLITRKDVLFRQGMPLGDSKKIIPQIPQNLSKKKKIPK